MKFHCKENINWKINWKVQDQRQSFHNPVQVHVWLPAGGLRGLWEGEGGHEDGGLWRHLTDGPQHSLHRQGDSGRHRKLHLQASKWGPGLHPSARVRRWDKDGSLDERLLFMKQQNIEPLRKPILIMCLNSLKLLHWINSSFIFVKKKRSGWSDMEKFIETKIIFM